MRSAITEAERSLIAVTLDHDPTQTLGVVERILADRESEGWASYAAEQERHAELREQIRALADEYDNDHQTPWRLIRDLRALGGSVNA